MFNIFVKGGPIMWPLLLTSIIALSVVIERFIFTFLEKSKRDGKTVQTILGLVEKGDLSAATNLADKSDDFIARTLSYGLQHRKDSLVSALMFQANQELKRFDRGLWILDTSITLAPFLGLLGTVTGMIHSFGLLGAQELGAPIAITGGIAQALIATAFGLVIAIMALIPFNFLNARLENAKHDIENATTHLELLLTRQGQMS